MSATLLGAKELERTLKTLGERVQRKVTRQAVNAACTPIVKAARKNAPQESGLLKEAMDKRIKTYPESMTVVGIVGPDTATKGEFKGEPRWPAKYAHLVEGGHLLPDGTFVPPNPFLRNAYDSTEAQALDAMKTKLAAGIEREAAKQG
jgi:HK97 gp10 family phage protein